MPAMTTGPKPDQCADAIASAPVSIRDTWSPPDNLSPSHAVLALLARIDMDDNCARALSSACAGPVKWDEFLSLAEHHAVAPLAGYHLLRAGTDLAPIAIPQSTRRALQALAMRHRDADSILNQNLFEIIEAAAQDADKILVLKGAALCHLIYPDSSLRPRRDIDLLVPKRFRLAMQRRLIDIGFYAPAQHAARAMRFHHHLPIASRQFEGMQVSVEIHHDALSGDYPLRLRFEGLKDHPQPFQFAGRDERRVAARALGHHDMLQHLCLHALEPGGDFRLIALADIYGYFSRHIDVLDAATVNHNRIDNTLTLLNYLAPLPPAAAYLAAAGTTPPSGVGHNMPTLKTILAANKRNSDRLKQLLFPSPWWMHAYYGVPPGEPLGRLRYGRHLARVCRWARRRAIAIGLPGQPTRDH